MNNLLKRQSIGAYITLGALLVAIVGLIFVGVTINAGDHVQVANGGEYYLLGEEFGGVITLGVLAVVFLLLGCLASELKLQGLVGKIVGVVAYALRLMAPVFLIMTFVGFLQLTLTGLGWTYFSNEELEIYQAAKDAGQVNIIALVILVVAFVLGIVAAFFKIVKEDEEPAQQPQEAEAPAAE